MICTRFAAVIPTPETAATTSSRLWSRPEFTVTVTTASSGCAVELCEAVTVTVLLASCASRGAAGIKKQTTMRRRDIDRFYYLRPVLNFGLDQRSVPVPGGITATREYNDPEWARPAGRSSAGAEL